MGAIIRAARLEQHGQPLEVQQVKLPDPGPGEVFVELCFGGVNPVDRYTAEGRVAPDGPLPRTLGAEASGLIEGRPVLVNGEGLGAVRDGVWASAAVVPREAVTELPEGVGLQQAAAMGIAGLTAWKVVHELGRVAPEDRVLVLGASGGVGGMIVSLARAAGASVIGQTGSEEKVAVVLEAGAQRAVVAGADQLAGAIAGLQPTIVFDPLGDGFVAPVLDALTARGRLVSFGTSAGAEVALNMQTLYRKGITVLGYGGMLLSMEERQRGLGAALRALADGQLKVLIDEVLALEQVNDAFARLVERKVAGNLLLALQ